MDSNTDAPRAGNHLVGMLIEPLRGPRVGATLYVVYHDAFFSMLWDQLVVEGGLKPAEADFAVYTFKQAINHPELLP